MYNFRKIITKSLEKCIHDSGFKKFEKTYVVPEETTSVAKYMYLVREIVGGYIFDYQAYIVLLNNGIFISILFLSILQLA